MTASIGVPSQDGAGTRGPWPKKSSSPFFLACLIFLAYACSLLLTFKRGVTSADGPFVGVATILLLLGAAFSLPACIFDLVCLFLPLYLVFPYFSAFTRGFASTCLGYDALESSSLLVK
jgi:hypothetical protein